MVYRRAVYQKDPDGSRRKVGERPSWYFEARQRVGYTQLCTWTPDKRLAQRIEQMWSELAERHRAWDLLEPVLADSRRIGALYDVWTETRGNVEEMRRRAADVNVEPLVAEWNAVLATQVGADWAAHALAHVRYFFPEGTPRLASAVNADWITTKLAEYPGKRNTRRKVHSSLSSFLAYCVLPKKLFAASPMAHVERPAQERSPVVFYDAATVSRIVAWQPDEARRAFFALVYGTGADVSPAIMVSRADINPATKEVRIAGTKAEGRDRIVRVNDAHWPTFWGYAKTVITGRIFPESWNRWTVSDWHRQTVGDGVKNRQGDVERAGLHLTKRLPLRKARHHFAVRLLESSAPIRVVAEQLGSDERTVLRHYGPWITSADDRSRAEKMATKHETKRREAK